MDFAETNSGVLVPRKMVPVTEELAGISKGRDITRPYIEALDILWPQDTILMGRGGGNLEIYEKVLQDEQVEACLQQRFSAVVSREYEVTPGDSRQDSQKAADFLKEILGIQIKANDKAQKTANKQVCLWDNVTEKMLYAVFYGFSIGECLYRRDGRYVTLDETKGGIRVRNRRRFVFGADQQPRLLTLADSLQGEILPDRKFWHLSFGGDHDDDPFGKGCAHWLYWPVFFKRNDMKYWLIFLEKFGQPSVLGKYPPGSSKAQKDKLLAAARALMSEAAITIPDGMMLELLEASRSGTADYAELWDKMNAAISKVILSQTMTTDDGASLSQSQVHFDVRQDVVKRDAALIDGSFNRTVVRWLIDYNRDNFPLAAYPQVWRRLEDNEDLTQRADRDVKIFGFGYRPNLETVTEVYGDGYEPIGQRPEAVPNQPTDPNSPQPPTPAIPQLNLSDSLPFAEQRQMPSTLILDRFTAQLQEQAQPAIEAWTVQLKEMLDGSKNLIEFRDQLDQAFPDLNGETLTQVMAEAMFASKLAGIFEAEGGE